MSKFRLRERVRRIGKAEVRTVEEIREGPQTETLYSIQLGRDFATLGMGQGKRVGGRS
jgi:hypothetical protein